MPRFHRSVLLYNGQAGASTSEELISLAVPVIARESKKLELIQTESEEDFIKACKATETADALFVAGGDGTVHLAVQALSEIENPPVLGILPSGTCNDFARTLQIPILLDEAAEELVRGDVKEIDTAQINGQSFLNFAGIGIITDASANIDAHLKEKYGKLGYFMGALQSMRQATPFSFTLDVDGTEFTDEAVLLLVMNGNSIGTHTFPLASIDPSDGLLDVFVIQTTSMAAILEWFSLSQPDTVPEELEHVNHFQGRQIIIRTAEEMDVDTDGEIYEKTPVKIAIQPKKLSMLVPAEQEPDLF